MDTPPRFRPLKDLLLIDSLIGCLVSTVDSLIGCILITFLDINVTLNLSKDNKKRRSSFDLDNHNFKVLAKYFFRLKECFINGKVLCFDNRKYSTKLIIVSKCIIYSGRQLYQHNEDDFLLKFLLLVSFFQITSLQVIKEKLFNRQFLFTSMFVVNPLLHKKFSKRILFRYNASANKVNQDTIHTDTIPRSRSYQTSYISIPNDIIY